MPPHAEVQQWEHLPFPKSLRDFQRLFPEGQLAASADGIYESGWNEALDEAIKIAEDGIADMEAQHASWRDAFGKGCAQPYEEEINVRRRIVDAIRKLKD